MKSKSNSPQRRAMRLRDYDYSQPGAYFVTICAQHRKCLFGAITDGKMRLNEIGQIVIECWNHIWQHFPSVELGESVIMPNHFHGIISWGITETRFPHPPENINTRRGEVSSSVGTNPTNRRGEVPSPSLGKIMAYFKYQSTKVYEPTFQYTWDAYLAKKLSRSYHPRRRRFTTTSPIYSG